MHPRQVWQTALAELRGAMSQATFETWVKNTAAVDGASRKGHFTIAAPNTFAKEWLDNRFREQIEATLGRILGRATRLEVLVEGSMPEPTPAKRKPVPAQPRLLSAPATTDPAVAPAPDDGSNAPPRPHRRKPAVPSMDDRWTFDSFVVGPSNRFAFAAAEAVAEDPAGPYNPLFIHGGVGLGKTHLLHAIAHHTAAQGLRTLYVTCEQFTNDLIDAIQRRQTDAFRAAYRSNDVLLVDDVQFLAGKESTQDEFFHTFNELHGARKQIVISSDRPPRAIATLEQRLTSRFEWGLIADIQPPDLETRTAILRARAAEQAMPVPADVIALLAQRISRNVRELEGALTTVVAYARLNGAPLGVETAQRALAEVAAGRPRPLQPAEVVDAVAKHFQVDPKLLRGKQRDRDIVLPRQVAMYLMREETSVTLLEIGRELGGRDHTTVLHGWEKIKSEVETDDRLRREVIAVRERLQSNGYGH